MQHFSPILRRVLGILAFCFFGSQLYSQNLIPNGSFEEGINCPSTIGNITEECTAWYASLIDNEGPNPTPDWFHECSEFDLLAPPDIAFGYQLPYEGGGYVGLATFSSNHSEAREIVGVELLEPLAIGETYLVEFFLTEVSNIGFAIFTNNIGYNFSTHPFYDVANFPINTSHFSIDTVVHSSSEWTQVISEFTADSNYTHFHIGNFYDDASTDTVLAGGVAGVLSHRLRFNQSEPFIPKPHRQKKVNFQYLSESRVRKVHCRFHRSVYISKNCCNQFQWSNYFGQKPSKRKFSL